MKKNLVKVMVAAMAFAAALAMTSCANPAGSTPANTPAGGSSGDTLLYTLDFSGAELPENWYVNTDTNRVFTPNDSLKLIGGWNEFALSPKSVANLSEATKVAIEFKCDVNPTWGDTDNDGYRIALVTQDPTTNNPTNYSWTFLYKASVDGATSTTYKTVTKAINWEVKAPENLPKISNFNSIQGIKIWAMNCGDTDSINIKSIKFYK
ncbi:MAG: hypothetical protein MJ169_04745 [Treponema sp.]|nr:hypothetical protein [Treponema sp.]